jgi:hypothetical protein
MTRAQVARYLRRSVASVRRAEGRHLHPYRDAKGVFRFEPDEVRELRAALERGEVRLGRVDFTQQRQVRSGPTKRAHDAVESLHVTALQHELAELREIIRTLLSLFYSICPARLLCELDPELLDALDSIESANATAR